LQKKIADGKKVGRWEPRSQRCIYLGFSPDHAKDVPLVLNPATGSLTAQWNVVFEDWFATVSRSEHDLPDFNAEDWSNMFGTTTSHVPDEIPIDDEPGVPDAPSSRDNIARKSTRFAHQFHSLFLLLQILLPRGSLRLFRGSLRLFRGRTHPFRGSIRSLRGSQLLLLLLLLCCHLSLNRGRIQVLRLSLLKLNHHHQKKE